MSRLYVIRDGGGERRLGDDALPLQIGGPGADVVVPGCQAGRIAAYVALSDGHAYVQSSPGGAGEVDLFLNHERLTGSAWLKSGDAIEIGEAVVAWTVRGDQVFIEVHARAEALIPPPHPPPTGAAGRDDGTGGSGRVVPSLPMAHGAGARSARSGRLRSVTIAGLSMLALVVLEVILTRASFLETVERGLRLPAAVIAGGLLMAAAIAAVVQEPWHWAGLVAGAALPLLGVYVHRGTLQVSEGRDPGPVLDITVLLLAALMMLVPPAGYLLLLFMIWLAYRVRRLKRRKYKGLRILA